MAKSWSWAASTFETQFSTQFAQIKRGKKFEARLGSESWSRGCWVLSLKQLSSALHDAAMGTDAAIGNLVVELDGMSIGGVMSNAAVSTRFAFEESFNPHRGTIDWLRYVDDVLGFSRCMCGSCLQSFFQGLYSEPVSLVHNSDIAEVRFFQWLNLELHHLSDKLCWTLKTTIVPTFTTNVVLQSFRLRSYSGQGSSPCTSSS